MPDQQTPAASTNGGPLPPWLQKPAGALSQQSKPVQPPVNIPGPWSRPAPAKPADQPTPSSPVAQPNDGTKDWGPLKPIRTVPKPDEKKVAYVLAQTERVVNPEEEHTRKKWIILGTIVTLILIIGGTLAFIFFGRNTQGPKLDSDSIILVNTRPKNGNVNTNSVFPSTNVNNTNASITLDSDKDGLTDKQEELYGTDPNKADTDGDGYTDSQEVQGGYNPLGPGKL